MINVSVIIVNYNTCKMTAECIASVFEKTKDLSIEVILVDNHSTDESKEFFEKDSRIKYIYSYENMGFGRANNVGMMLAKGEYFFLLNSDTLLVNNAIKMFYDYAESHEKNAFYGCWLENDNGISIHSCGKIPTISSILWDSTYVYRKLFNKNAPFFVENIPYSKNESTSVGFVTGADLFFNRSIYHKIGAFDHDIFMYYEESDYQKRGHAKNIATYCINGPRIVHFEGASQKKRNGKLNKIYFERGFVSRKYYISKHYNKIQYLFFWICFAILEMPRWAFLNYKAIPVLFK